MLLVGHQLPQERKIAVSTKQLCLLPVFPLEDCLNSQSTERLADLKA